MTVRMPGAIHTETACPNHKSIDVPDRKGTVDGEAGMDMGRPSASIILRLQTQARAPVPAQMASPPGPMAIAWPTTHQMAIIHPPSPTPWEPPKRLVYSAVYH
jgi:hypothetical protein